MKFQYQPEGDVSSLIEASLNFLLNLKTIQMDNEKSIWPIYNDEVNNLNFLKSLKIIAEETEDRTNPNYIFSTLYYYLFIVPNRIYVKDVFYESNLISDKLSISQEKVNAWKRIMEYLGLGYRVYGGFYAVPQFELTDKIIKEIGYWEGPLQLFFERKINNTLPCIYNGTVFKGVVYAFLNLGKNNIVEISKKQDLPYQSFGEWNWIRIGGDHS